MVLQKFNHLFSKKSAIMGKTIGILSLKGGVGKTSTVVALGDAISSFGKRVLLVDGNLSSPNLGLHLKIVEPGNTLHEVLGRTTSLKDSIYNYGDFDVLPSRIFTNFRINPFDLRDKLKNLKRKYDFILIDSSPNLDRETLAVMLASDEIFIVTTPDHPTMSTTLKAIKMANQRGTKINGLILNKVYHKDFELDLDDIERTLDLPVLGVVPHDMNFPRALSNFTPLPSFSPDSKASDEYKKIAGVLTGNKYKPKLRLNDIFNIAPKREDINREVFYARLFG